ncbi:MAG: TM2 domain-containing protein [Serratia bockelmannii]
MTSLIFCLGMKWWGLFYLLFCWTGIPAIVGFIEGIIYLFQSEEKFNQKYNPGLI